MPRVNHAGTPARRSATSSSDPYTSGARSSTAISSNGVPARASSRIRRAISTVSRPSPGAEKNRTSPLGSPGGTFAA